jgi:uncharacterized protein
MPVRSLNSSVLKWPDRDHVDRALRHWAKKELTQHPEVLRFGYFGSYARGDWGVGSDLDLLAIVDHDTDAFDRRSLKWDLLKLPVAAELLIYTLSEWQSLESEGGRFVRALAQETEWVYEAHIE